MEPTSLVASFTTFRNVDPSVFHDGFMPCPSFDLLVRAIFVPTLVAITTILDSTWYNVTEHISNLVRSTIDWHCLKRCLTFTMRVRFDASWVDVAPSISVHLNTATEPLEVLKGGIDLYRPEDCIKSILLEENFLSLEVGGTGYISTGGTPCPELQVCTVSVGPLAR